MTSDEVASKWSTPSRTMATSSRKLDSDRHAAGPRVYSSRGPLRGSFGGGLVAFGAPCARTGTAIAIATTAHTRPAKRTEKARITLPDATLNRGYSRRARKTRRDQQTTWRKRSRRGGGPYPALI